MGGAKNCPETPRQKMIGMMYLVLTAMLALNVSTDVLNAFKLVDDSLHSTLSSTESRNVAMMNDFRAIRDDNPQKAGEWYNKAVEMTQRSDSLYNFIQDFKYQIALATDGPKKADPEARVVEGKDNRDVTSHYALPDTGEKPGVVLKNKIIDYRNYLISLDTTKAADFNAIFSTADKVKEDGDIESWEEQMFHDMPSGAALPLLTKLQNDIRNAQSTMIQYLCDRTDAGDVRVNKLSAYVIPESRYVMRGDKYRARIIMAGIDSTKTPEYYVDGQKLNARGEYEVPASTTGTKKYSGWISYIDPASGDAKQLPFNGEYTVNEPAVTISNVELNIMYRGYDNKFSVSVPGVSNDKIKVSVTGATVRQNAGHWIIVPGEGTKSVKVSVSADIDGKIMSMGTKDYRVKQLPPPTAYFNAKEKDYASGDISIGRLLDKSGFVNASYGTDGILDLPFKVLGFTLYVNGQYLDSKSNKFTKEQIDKLSKLKSGSLIMIQDIKAVGPTGKEQRLTSLTFKLN